MRIALIAVQALLGVFFIASGGGKLLGIESELQRFDRIGLGQWLRYVTGTCELAGGLALLAPGYAGPGALLLSTVMVGALVAQFIALDRSLVPAGLLVLTLGIAWARHDQTRRLLDRRTRRRAVP